ncbi:hypothetical protein C4578_03065 [Candidatus Microgenomates bacterium]|jgi:cytidylate kinase|nr:MAG: hypothetical protein C4578_03065 [Candidatus Microgenomates bacterium]
MIERNVIGENDWESVALGNTIEIKSTDGLEVKILNPENIKNVLSQANFSKPLFIFISGTSESGKSTFGKLAVKTGIAHRLKIYKTLAEMSGEKGLPEMVDNPFNYATSIATNQELVEEVSNKILENYVGLMQQTDIPIAVVETIKHQWMVEQFRGDSSIRFLSIFIDADLEKRIVRESKKSGKSIDIVRSEVHKKDVMKQTLGSEEVENSADIYISNNGSLESYEDMILSFLKILRSHSIIYSGEAHDYSLD